MEYSAAILCGGVEPRGKLPDVRTELKISTFGRSQNVTIKISDISERLSTKIPDRWVDLLEIAVYVYGADQLVTRGGSGVPNLGGKWSRQFHFCIPVRDIKFWSTPNVQDVLKDTLDFLSDDSYSFHFFKGNNLPPLEEYLELAQPGRTYHEADSVMLFSGGLDSLAGAVQEMIADSKRVVVVNHRSTGKLAGPTQDLVTLLGSKAEQKEPIFVPVWANKKNPSRDFNQRTRSFIYAALAATVSSLFGLFSIRFYENGVTSINLPITEQVIGSRASRSTHPRVIAGYTQLFSLIAEKDFKVETPFIWKIKADIVSLIGEYNCQDLIPHTRSCNHPIKATKGKYHCGVCSQCIDRRFATLASGLVEFDPADKYKVDLFTGSIPEGKDRTMAESMVRLAQTIKELTDEQLLTKYPELNHIYQYLDIESYRATENIVNLLLRHAEQVCRVMDEGLRKYATQLNEGKLPIDCLIALAIPDEYKHKQGKAEKPTMPTFKKENGAWLLIFEDVEKPVKHSKGMYYIRDLLSTPNKTITHEEIWSRYGLESSPVSVSQKYSTISKEHREEEGLYVDSIKKEEERDWKTLKKGFQDEFKRINAELQEAKECGDQVSIEKHTKEKSDLTRKWNKFFDIRGNPRELVEKTPARRRRKSINTAISRACSEIKKVHPKLAAHLRDSLKLTPHLRYTPYNPIKWIT